MGILFFVLLVIGGFLLIKSIGNNISIKKWSKRCPNCGHLCKPTGGTSNIYWKGSGGRPAYFYHCPNCGRDFDNR